jgi:hypothetical protein
MYIRNLLTAPEIERLTSLFANVSFHATATGSLTNHQLPIRDVIDCLEATTRQRITAALGDVKIVGTELLNVVGSGAPWHYDLEHYQDYAPSCRGWNVWIPLRSGSSTLSVINSDTVNGRRLYEYFCSFADEAASRPGIRSLLENAWMCDSNVGGRAFNCNAGFRPLLDSLSTRIDCKPGDACVFSRYTFHKTLFAGDETVPRLTFILRCVESPPTLRPANCPKFSLRPDYTQRCLQDPVDMCALSDK